MTRPDPELEASSRRYAAPLRRGALTNAVGVLAKLAVPVMLIAITRLFGPSITGVFLLTVFAGDIARSAVVVGYSDAVTVFGSRAVGAGSEADDDEGVYQVVAAALFSTLAISALLLLAITQLAGPVAEGLFPGQSGFSTALLTIAAALPFMAIAQVTVAATKVRMHMQYEVGILGFAQPTIVLALAFAAAELGTGLEGLMLAYLVSYVAAAAMGAWALSRHYSWVRVLRASARILELRDLHAFALPQNLNMTFSRYQTRLDALMLPMFAFDSAAVAFYGTAALIAASLREVKLVFSSVLAPIAARHHGSGEMNELQEVLGRVSRWTTSLVVPLIVVAAAWRQELLVFVDASYTHDSTFMLLLLWPPFASCAFGLAGNCIVYTGHTTWNLINSVLAAALNTTLNLLLIAEYGLLGAAGATAISSLMITSLQLVELRFLEGITIPLRSVYKPHLALALLVGALMFLGDPADLVAPERLALTVGLLLLYVLSLLVLRHEELIGMLRLRRSAAS